MIYIQFVVDLAEKLTFCYRLYARAGEMGARANERCWLEGSFERVPANFSNFAILNQIIPLLHTTIDCNFNVLDVYRN